MNITVTITLTNGDSYTKVVEGRKAALAYIKTLLERPSATLVANIRIEQEV